VQEKRQYDNDAQLQDEIFHACLAQKPSYFIDIKWQNNLIPEHFEMEFLASATMQPNKT